jgi:hypothetical protein
MSIVPNLGGHTVLLLLLLLIDATTIEHIQIESRGICSQTQA